MVPTIGYKPREIMDPTQTQSVQQPPTEQPIIVPSDGDVKKKMLFLIIGIIFIVPLAVGGWYFVSSTNTTKPTTSAVIAPTTAPSPTLTPTEEQELESIDTGAIETDPEITDLEKDLENL